MGKFLGALGGTSLFVFHLVVCVAIYGWIENIIRLVHDLGGPVTTIFIARVVGVFVPFIGAIMGFISG